ncbi:MAG: C-terminal binding protein [Streptosporangiaceae bacterium]
MTTSRPRVLLTDHAWPGVDVEAGLCDAAGFDLVEAPPGATEDELATLAADVDGILTCWAQVTAKVIAASPALRVVSRMGIGLDNIDLAAAATRRITVTRVPDYCVEEVSDHVVGLLHAWARCILTADRDVRAGITDPGRYAPRRVSSLVAGVWGLGPTGHRTAEKLVMMCDQEQGGEVLADDRHPELAPSGVRTVPADVLLAECDVLSLHLPLTAATRGLLDAARLARMKPGALLVNTSRGALVDIDALVAALDAGTPGAAALDVFPAEPEVPAALLTRPDVILTPHIAFSSAHSVLELRRRSTEDLLRVLAGMPPLNPVTQPDG